MAPQQGIVRDIQHAEGTPEQTYIDRSTYMPEMIKSLGRGFGDIAEMDRWSRTQKNAGSKQNKPDPAPLAEATAKMQEAFSGDESFIPEKKEDYLKQYYTWAYRQGYDNADIDAMIKEYGINDYTEDVTKFRKEASTRSGDLTQIKIEQGYKIDPRARTPEQALVAFNKAMMNAQVIDAKVNKAVAQSAEDSDKAVYTLQSLTPDLIEDIGAGFNRYLSTIGGSANLTEQGIQDMESRYRQALIDKELPEWYATYVTDTAFYPYKKIAKASDAERVEATTSADNYIKNVTTATEMRLLNSPMLGSLTPLQIRVIRDVLSNEAFSTVLSANPELAKNLLDLNFGGDFNEQIMKATAKNKEALDAFMNTAPDEVQEGINRASAENIKVVPDVASGLRDSGYAYGLATPAAYEAATPGTSVKALETVDKEAEQSMVKPIMFSAAQDVKASVDGLVLHFDETGKSSVLLKDNDNSLMPYDKSVLTSSEPHKVSQAVRDITKMLRNMKARTGYTTKQLSQYWNESIDTLYGINQTPLSEDTKKLFRATEEPAQMSVAPDKDSYENSAAKHKWELMSPEEQLAEMSKGEEAIRKSL